MLLRISPVMTGLAAALLLVSMVGLRKAFSVLRPIFRERAKINAEVSGRLTESLSGVRVVKGYHAEEREHDVFTKGVQRLLDNVIKSLTTMSMMSFSTTALGGVVGALVMLVGAHAGPRRKNHGRAIHELHGVSGVHDRAGVSSGRHRHATDRSGRGTRAHARSARRAARG